MLTTTLNAGAIDVHVSAPTGYGLFGASGNNHALGFNVVGSQAGLNVTNLQAAFTALWSQKDVDGNPIGLRGR